MKYTIDTMMTEEQFRQILTQTLTSALAEQDKRLDQKLNTELTVFFCQITRYIDKRLDQAQSEYRAGIHQLQVSIDGYIGRLTSDEHERAAMGIAHDRHTSWIKQLSVATRTRLVPEL